VIAFLVVADGADPLHTDLVKVIGLRRCGHGAPPLVVVADGPRSIVRNRSHSSRLAPKSR
jgi:hypothetical protein